MHALEITLMIMGIIAGWAIGSAIAVFICIKIVKFIERNKK